MSKEELREKLFNEFEKVEDGILVTDFLDKTKVIREKWYNLNSFIRENKGDDLYIMYPNIAKFINYNGVNYLIISFRHYCYLIIDITNKKTLKKDEVNSIFDEEFFVNNLEEIPISNESSFKRLLSIVDYDSDIDKIINYVKENEEFFLIKPNIFYREKIDNAEIILNLSLNKPNSILMFLTEDQYLYEHLFMDEFLNPLSMQDATSRIGKNKMDDYFKRIKNIKISYNQIDENILNIIKEKQKKLMLQGDNDDKKTNI